MPDPVDLARLREFCDGSDESFRMLARLFLAEADEAGADLARAIDAGALMEIEAIAHRAAGSAGACGAAVLAGMLFKMESAAHVRSADETAALWPALRQELGVVRRFLSETIAVDGVGR